MNALVYGSVCSGIEAASLVWRPLGWRCAFMSEIEAFPRAVLAHHYPEVPLHGDFQTIQPGDYESINVLVGGTPCQSFSVAGLRGGMADDRGNLALQFLALAGRLRPEWVVWENVPGVLSSAGGRDFGSFLGGLGELGYGWAYRTLDAQYFGVPQRRRRVFVVGYLGDWRRAASVLFERHCMSGHPPPRREAGEGVAPPIAGCSNGGGANGPGRTADDAEALIAYSVRPQAHGRVGDWRPSEGTLLTAHEAKSASTLIAHSLRADGFDASEDGTGRGTSLIVGALAVNSGPNGHDSANFACNQAVDAGHILPVAFSAKDHGADAETDLAPTLRAGGHTESHANAGVMPAIAFHMRQDPISGDVAQPLEAKGPNAIAFALRGREGGAMPEVGDGSASALRSASGGSTRDYVAFDTTQVTSKANRSNPQPGDACHPLARGAHAPAIAGTVRSHTRPGSNEVGSLATTSAVRRLTPLECERLQGFPDDFTMVPYRGKPAADGPRYKALGNSMAVPCMAWLGCRIDLVRNLPLPQDPAP